MSEDATEQYFPTPEPPVHPDAVARWMAVVAILLALALPIAVHLQRIADVRDARRDCEAYQNDVRAEQAGWLNVRSTLDTVGVPSSGVDATIRRQRSVLRRNCAARHAQPALLDFIGG